MADLVDRLLGIVFEESEPEVKTLVGHRFPDDDVWLCLWIAKRFIHKVANARIVFVNAGESLPGSDGDLSVLHFDTGGGEYDHHGNRQGSCSAAILVEKLKFNNPGFRPLIEMATAVDNVKPLPPTSLHCFIEGFPRLLKKPDGGPDWQQIEGRIFELFDIVYGQETSRVRAAEAFDGFADRRRLTNGLKMAVLIRHPECREEAFGRGAHVVVWTQPRGRKNFYVGVQTNRDYPELRLRGVVAALRSAEAVKRQININGRDLDYLGRGEPVSNWFLHDSQRLVLSGSRSWKLREEEFTKLATDEIIRLVCRALSAIPSGVIASWK